MEERVRLFTANYWHQRLTQEPKLTNENQILSSEQRSLLAAVLNRIIPANDQMPAAGDLGIGTFIEGVAAGNSDLIRLFNEGLTAIAVAAGQNPTQAFESLSNVAKDELLKAVEVDYPAFFDQLVLQTYNGYYTNTEVFKAIGYELPKTPEPGALPELLDESLLDQQKQREPFWKKV